MKLNQHEQDEAKFLILLQNAIEDSYEEVIEDCCHAFFLDIPTEEGRKTLMRRLAQNYMNETLVSQEEFALTQEEIDRCRAIESPLLKRIFYCLVVQSKLHPHKNGWVELDWPKVLAIAFEANACKKIKIENLADLKDQGLDLRVIGSRNPILCFSLPDSNDPSPVCCLKKQEAKKFFDKEIRDEQKQSGIYG